jgi:enolase
MSTLKKLTGLEILDSRGKPTVKAICEFSNGLLAQASVPSGASTGKAEAIELRDGDPHRYAGQGCRMAQTINQTIHLALQGQPLQTRLSLTTLVSLSTPNKSRWSQRVIGGFDCLCSGAGCQAACPSTAILLI